MSVPFYGEEFTFTQPDGTRIRVRGWGDEKHAAFETLDGLPVVRNPDTGFYEYAVAAEAGEALAPGGAQPGPGAPDGTSRSTRGAARARSQAGSGLPDTPSRWRVRLSRSRAATRSALESEGPLPAPPSRQTVGDFVGLCLLVQFPDVPGTITREQVEAFCNQEGYTGFGNRGSVRDYFFDNSGGRLTYTNRVAPYYTARHPRDHYTDPSVPYGVRTRELIREALEDLREGGFGFDALTTDDEDFVYALNVFYAGERVNNWSEGLWPHAHNLGQPFELAPGRLAHDYQVTDMGSRLTLGTFCHENGHMVCDFPDLYDDEKDARSWGAGRYCLMCLGNDADPRNPTQVGAYLKYRAGWAESVTRITGTAAATLRAGRNEFLLHEKSRTEYFIVENRHRSGRDAALPDSGLAIWHVDELGDNQHEQMTPDRHYECSLEQADGRFDLERGEDVGDSGDLFRAGGKDRFADATVPGSRWWDGSPSGLEILATSPAGPAMTLTARA